MQRVSSASEGSHGSRSLTGERTDHRARVDSKAGSGLTLGHGADQGGSQENESWMRSWQENGAGRGGLAEGLGEIQRG